MSGKQIKYLKCDFCQEVLSDERYRRNAKYCSLECRNSAYARKFMASEKKSDVNTGTRGAIGELAASADLLERGYYVYRAVSPSCPCDLTVVKNGVTLRVEVTTGSYYGATKKINFPPKTKTQQHFDVLAIVLPDKIHYIPDIERALEVHTLKQNAQQRTLVLAQVLGAFLLKMPIFAVLKNESSFMDFATDALKQLNRVFPELTPEE